MVSHLETSSDSPIGSNRDRGHDRGVANIMESIGQEVLPFESPLLILGGTLFV